jgi:hypothetical protein
LSKDFQTGVPVGTVAEPDARDPRISGYTNPSAEEAYALLEEIKKKEPQRITQGLDLTDFDHVHSLVLPKLHREELREYQATVARERQEELSQNGIENTEAYNISLPTAREAGAQYDIHSENITAGDSFEIREGEKARLPGGQFVMGPGLVEVVPGGVSVQNRETGETEEGVTVTFSTPLGQGISVLDDPLGSAEAPEVDADALREEWIEIRAGRIKENTKGKKPLSAEEAAEMVSKNPRKYGYEGERFSDEGKRAYNDFAEKEIQKLVEKTKNARHLNGDEARRVAEKEYEEVQPRHKLKIVLRPDGVVYGVRPMDDRRQTGTAHPVNNRNGIHPNPLTWGRPYLDHGDDPEL